MLCLSVILCCHGKTPKLIKQGVLWLRISEAGYGQAELRWLGSRPQGGARSQGHTGAVACPTSCWCL